MAMFIPIVKNMSPLFKSIAPPYIDMSNDSEIISRLKFISKIGKGEKINTNFMFIQPDDMVTRLSRTFWNKDTRGRALSFITTTINNSFRLIESHICQIPKICNEEEKELYVANCRNILHDLSESRKGILNIKETYMQDMKIVCDLEALLQTIDLKIALYSKNELICAEKEVDNINE